MNEVIMYTKQICPFCVKAKGLLKAKGLTINEISIEGSNKLREEMIEKSKGLMTVPQIFINGNHIGGCDDLFALEAKGELEKIIA